MSADQALMGVSTGVGMAGSLREGQSAQAAANYNAAVQEQQAQITEAQAAEEERRQRAMARKVIGQGRANVGASGIQMEGSPLDVLEESAANAELDSLTIRNQGQLKAWAYRAGANMERFKGESAMDAANFKATAYLLKGISSGVASSGGGGGGG